MGGQQGWCQQCHVLEENIDAAVHMVCDKLSQHIVRQAQETSGDAAQTSGDLREGSAGGGGRAWEVFLW